MPEYQPVSSAHIAAIERPRCPDCRHDRMLMSKHVIGRSGCGTSTFECRKCGRVQTVVGSDDPLRSRVKGWLAGELKPPT